jgi:serine/threonine protein kinase
MLEKIGEGGMGQVYRARDEHLGRDVAIKILPTGTLADHHARKRFRQEADALSQLNHPNIATIYDFDTQEGVDFLVMEYIPGETLSEKLCQEQLAEKEVVRLGLQLVEELAAAHEHGVIHRDLKPGNLRLTSDERLKILDFGLARLARCLSPMAGTESSLDTVVFAGTLPYVAPEQLRGAAGDVRTDIYSVGVVLYELATGRLPFPEKLATALADDILHQAPPPLGRLRPELSPRLEEIVLKCLEKEPENRYQSAKELAVDLRRLLAPSTVTRPILRRKFGAGKTISLAAVGLAAVLLALILGLKPGRIQDKVFGSTAQAPIRSLAVLPWRIFPAILNKNILPMA